MSRTKRNSPKAHHNFYSNIHYSYELTHLDNVHGKWKYQSLDKGGWNEARRVLSKDDYNFLRKKQGDCYSKYVRHFSPPKYYRKKVERCVRQFGRNEIHHWLTQADYEVNYDTRYKLVDGWCWY